MSEDPPSPESSQQNQLNIDLNKGSETHQRNQSLGMMNLKPIFYTVAVVLVLWFLTPHFLRSRKNVTLTEAVNNIKQTGIALSEFETLYNTYPSSSASIITKKSTHTHDLSGTSSNTIFRQIFIPGITESENIFYAKIPGTKKPDNNITPDHLLEKGEVAFSYISGLSKTDNPASPFLLCPLIPGTTKFDPKPFEGKGIILRLDQSVSIYTIENDGHVHLNGIDILSPKHPIWNGKTPTIHHPEL